MEIKNLLIRNYLPYAKNTIIARAIPSIDGLKPVQRRILYAMNNMGLNRPDANRSKSVKVIGETMGKYHPHGDSSIYDAMVLMSTRHDKMNVPYLDAKGNWGKIYSKDLQYAAPRYTECKLTPVCSEFFEGINENAVDIIDNFDGTEKEPTLLPVKFPSILVNTSAGIAVGTSSNIPSFSLTNVCEATKGVLNGTIDDFGKLADALGAPEFTTGGFLHASRESLEKLCATGKGSFVITGRVEVYTNQIVITEIPFCTSAEDIIEAIDNRMKNFNELKGIQDVKDEIDLHGFRLVIDIKRGHNSRDVLQELCRVTPLRTKISFRTRVIVNDRCKELNLMDLLKNWIEFRMQCIDRMYQFRLNRDSEKEHLLATWDHIKDDILGVVKMISNNTDAVAKQNLINNYGLDEIQAEYLLNMKIRSITKDKAEKSLKELANIREIIKYEKLVVDSDQEKKNIINKELTEIINKYGKANKTSLAAELAPNSNKIPEVTISDEIVAVVLTDTGFVKRLTSTQDLLGTYASKYGDSEVYRWTLRNNQHILVFDRFGTVHKVLVDDIDAGRGKPTDKLYEKAGLEKPEDIIWADACGDYSGYFNLIYPNGKGTRVYYSEANPEGKRAAYKAGYDEVQPKKYWLTTENQFFLVTARNKAAYCDITTLGMLSNRTAFKVGRLSPGDYFTRMIYYKDLPNPSAINLDKYSKDYTVKIGDDMLWIDDGLLERVKEQQEKDIKEKQEMYRRNNEEAENKTNKQVEE